MAAKPIEQRSPYKSFQTFERSTHRFESDKFSIVVSTESTNTATKGNPLPEAKVSGEVIVSHKNTIGGNGILFQGSLEEFVELTRLALFARVNAGLPE